MRLFLAIALLLLLNNGHAQIISEVNFDEIKKEIADSTSKHYYPKLKKKLKDRDTSLTTQDYHHLYYGQIFQKGYHPYGTGNAKKDFLDNFKDHKYDTAINKGKLALKHNPVDLEVLLKMSICCLKVKRDEEKRYYAKLYYSFLEVIYNSGDGKSLESAYVVASVDHEYYIAGDLGLRVVHQQLIQDCDLLSFKKKDQKKVKGRKKIKELYFNVRMPLLSLSKAYKDADLPDPDDED